MWYIGVILVLIGAVQADRRPGPDECCPLCDYVFRDDGAFNYTYMYNYNRSADGLPVISYWINMTSQRWKDESWTNAPLWWHYLIINVPDQITYPEYGFLYVSGWSNTGSPPGFDSDHANKTAYYAADNGIITGAVYMIPNQPLVYTNDPQEKPRYEDDSIAYTWAEFMDQAVNGTCDEQRDTCYNTSCADPEVILQMPMCKAVVKAMDTMEIFVQQDLGLQNGVDKFMLAGQSKRGWTTWMTGPIDDRVIAMAPVVLSTLNLQSCFHHYYMSFGGWPLYFEDYWRHKIMGQIDEPHAFELYKIVDPYSYRQWMDFPKLVVSATSDSFFLLDDTHYWWEDLPGEKYFWLLENSGHRMSANPTYEEYWTMLQTYYLAVITDYRRPLISWKRVAPEEREGVGSITLYSEVKPTRISSYSALSVVKDRRDWRNYVKCDTEVACYFAKPTNINWAENTEIQDNGDGSYYVEYDVPSETDGFLAFYIRMEYEGPEGRTFVFTTEANIIPSYFPYDDCSGRNCTGILK